MSTPLSHHYDTLYHLVQESIWRKAVEGEVEYYPPTYQQDGFTHATAKPELLLGVANHFYKGVEGTFLVLVMETNKLKSEVKYEPAAPVGETEAVKVEDNQGQTELFPHIYGGIPPSSVSNTLKVLRDEKDGSFLSIEGL